MVPPAGAVIVMLVDCGKPKTVTPKVQLALLNVMLVRAVQLSNVLIPRFVTIGKVICFKFVHSQNRY